MNEESTILQKSLKDLFSAKMLQYSILPFLISMVVLYTLFFLLIGTGIDNTTTLDINTSQTMIQDGIPHTESFTARLEGTAIIQYLMSSALTSWIASFLLYTVGGFFTLYLSIFVALLIIGFLTHRILKEIQQRHYPDVAMIGFSNPLESIFLTLKWVFTMVALFFLLVPLYFIPLLNVIAFNIPLYYFFHKMMTYDVSSNICTREEDAIINSYYKTSLQMKTIALYILSLIPFVIFFASVFYVIYLGHTYFIEVRKLRNKA